MVAVIGYTKATKYRNGMCSGVSSALVVWSPAGVQDPPLEALAHPFEVLCVGISARAGEVADQVRVRPDEAIPEIQDVVDLIFQDVTRQAQIFLVFLSEENRLFEEIQVLETER